MSILAGKSARPSQAAGPGCVAGRHESDHQGAVPDCGGGDPPVPRREDEAAGDGEVARRAEHASADDGQQGAGDGVQGEQRHEIQVIGIQADLTDLAELERLNDDLDLDQDAV
ncbi:hypothetical protein [Blastococcus sp. PRF04-17]|uniref:hypothetical protein n=1 Tax=Blastococcus sp. PRF04-17 TaxID=2933797 RepID=UPI001FF2472D|nr:hypothetical protein [Blastococcus sp. PRF04-17]UOY02439.1 hypothetical protein MVA48_03360 [Blastococcus sp. PRF04-17]